MKKNLLLRGVINFLSNAVIHVGKGHAINEWDNGGYREHAIQQADDMLRLALWRVKKELEETKWR